jgi:hypothetical protein
VLIRGFAPIIVIALLVVWGFTLANIIRTPDHAYRAGSQLVWILVVILVPFIGVPLYWILGAPQR